MKKVLLTALLGGVAASAFAQTTPTTTVPPNTVSLGTHVLRPAGAGGAPACPTPAEGEVSPPNIDATPVRISLINPDNVAGVQARLIYEANVVDLINPATGTTGPTPSPAPNPPATCQSGREQIAGGASVIQSGGQPVAPVINYEAPAGNVGAVNLALASATGTNTPGVVVTLFFRPKAGVAAGTVSRFSFDPDPSKFVVARAQGQGSKNAIEGAFIIGGATDTSEATGRGYQGSVSTDGTRSYAFDSLGVLTIATLGTATTPGTSTNVGTTATRLGAPVEGRPGIEYGATGPSRIAGVAINGMVQIYTFPAAGGTPTTLPAPVQVGTAGTTTVRSSAIIRNNRVFFTDGQGNLRSVSATDATGAQSAAVPLGGGIASGTSTPAVFDPDGAGALPERVVVGQGRSIALFNAADLTPVTGATAITTTGNISSSPFVYATAAGATVGFVGDDGGNVYTFNPSTGAQIGTAVQVGTSVRASPFGLPGGAGALVVATEGQVGIVTATGTLVPGITLRLAPTTAPPAGTELFGFQQSPIIRDNNALIGDTLGNLYQVRLTGVGTGTPGVTAEPTRDLGGGAITSLASPATGRVSFVANRGTVVNTTYTP